MNRKKTLAIVLAAIMTVSTASTAFAAPAAWNSPVAYQYTVSDGVAVVNNADELKEALQGSESVIRLGTSITASITVESGRTVELDLAGNTLTNEAESHTITVKGVLTVTDSVGGGKVDNVNHARAAVWNEGSTALRGGEFTRSQENGQSEVDSGGNSYYVLVNHNSMEIYDGVSVSQDGNYSSMIENGWYNGNQNSGKQNSVMEIYGGLFTGGLNTVKNDDYGDLTIHGGTFNNVAQSAVLNWNVAKIKGGEFITGGESGNPVILNGHVKNNNNMDKGTLTIEGGTFRSENPNVPAIGKMSGSSGSETAQITGGVFCNPIAAESYKKVEIGAEAAQVQVTTEADATVYRIGEDARSFEVQEGDIVHVKKLPDGQSMELYGDADTVTVFNETGNTIVVNDTQIKDTEVAGVQVPVIPDAPEREERDTTGGDYFGNAKWAEVKREIAAAEEGDTIEMSATGLPWFPSSAARALKGKDVTLEVRKNGVTYSINGLKIGSIDKIWYEFDQIETELLTAEAE